MTQLDCSRRYDATRAGRWAQGPRPLRSTVRSRTFNTIHWQVEASDEYGVAHA
jgi:hypothetical protein